MIPTLVLLVLAGPVAADADPATSAKQARSDSTPATKPISSAVDLASKWGVVTSVKRSPAHNRAVGGAENSFHLFGRAIDIARRPNVRHSDIEAAYRRAGFHLIESLDEGDHSHFAFGGRVGRTFTPPPRDAQLASSSAAPELECPSVDASAANARRRPDKSDGCPQAPSPAPRLRPLEPAS